jgi:hypothetical protein
MSMVYFQRKMALNVVKDFGYEISIIFLCRETSELPPRRVVQDALRRALRRKDVVAGDEVLSPQDFVETKRILAVRTPRNRVISSRALIPLAQLRAASRRNCSVAALRFRFKEIPVMAFDEDDEDNAEELRLIPASCESHSLVVKLRNSKIELVLRSAGLDALDGPSAQAALQTEHGFVNPGDISGVHIDHLCLRVVSHNCPNLVYLRGQILSFSGYHMPGKVDLTKPLDSRADYIPLVCTKGLPYHARLGLPHRLRSYLSESGTETWATSNIGSLVRYTNLASGAPSTSWNLDSLSVYRYLQYQVMISAAIDLILFLDEDEVDDVSNDSDGDFENDGFISGTEAAGFVAGQQFSMMPPRYV